MAFRCPARPFAQPTLSPLSAARLCVSFGPDGLSAPTGCLDRVAERAGCGSAVASGRGRRIAMEEWSRSVVAQVAEVTVATIGNAIHAATGRRLRALPFAVTRKHRRAAHPHRPAKLRRLEGNVIQFSQDDAGPGRFTGGTGLQDHLRFVRTWGANPLRVAAVAMPRPILDRLGLKATRIRGTLRNLPPASVYRISRCVPRRLPG